jgi:hypothetical protein
MCDSFMMSLKWAEFKRKYLTKYPVDCSDQFWLKAEEVSQKIQSGEMSFDGSYIVVDKELFVMRGNNRWYMLCPTTKTVWLATDFNKDHLVKIIILPRWEKSEILDSFLNALKYYVH